LSDPTQQGRAISTAGLAAALVVAFGLRALGFEEVFLEDGTVVFQLGDAFYHARRALLTFLDFPRVPSFDPWLNHPHGAPIPYPPLFDFALAALARLFGASIVALERTGAWASPVLGSLTVLPVYALGRRIHGNGVGLGAAWLYAVLPLGAVYSRVGNADHHAAVALLAAVTLALYAKALDDRTRGSALLRAFAALTLSRAALLLVWQGALLYLGPGELAFLFAAVALGRRDLLRGQLLSCLGAATLILPFVVAAQTPVGGPYSAVELSRFHVLCLGLAAAVAGGVLLLEGLRPAGSPARRVVRAALLCAVVGGLLLLLPAVREGLQPAFVFLGRAEVHAATTLEQWPLFTEAPGSGRPAAVLWLGYYAYLIPVVPLAFLWRPHRGALGAPDLLLFAWSLIFGALALQQLRWANDYAPLAAVGFALILTHGRSLLPRIGLRSAWSANGLTLVVAAALLWPSLRGFHAVHLRPTLAYLRDGALREDRALRSVEGTLVRFVQAVRAATPGPTDPTDLAQLTGELEYGMLASPGLVHVLRYVALRTAPADSFGPYVAGDRYEEMRRFFELSQEEEAVALMQQLDARYVVTHDPGEEARGTLLHRLHRGDGVTGEGAPPFKRFRLVTEGPGGGFPYRSLYARRVEQGVPYKLFEQVAGAVLEVRAPPQTRVAARAVVQTPTGRRFAFRNTGIADGAGRVRLRVPYATRSAAPARPLGPYQISAGSLRLAVDVTDQDVLEGRTLVVEAMPR
jgi:dolichyl-diphosphooligosaccharide--protein glycosyltransferase